MARKVVGIITLLLIIVVGGLVGAIYVDGWTSGGVTRAGISASNSVFTAVVENANRRREKALKEAIREAIVEHATDLIETNVALRSDYEWIERPHIASEDGYYLVLATVEGSSRKGSRQTCDLEMRYSNSLDLVSMVDPRSTGVVFIPPSFGSASSALVEEMAEQDIQEHLGNRTPGSIQIVGKTEETIDVAVAFEEKLPDGTVTRGVVAMSYSASDFALLNMDDPFQQNQEEGVTLGGE